MINIGFIEIGIVEYYLVLVIVGLELSSFLKWRDIV